jgi:hypothetical protein
MASRQYVPFMQELLTPGIFNYLPWAISFISLFRLRKATLGIIEKDPQLQLHHETYHFDASSEAQLPQACYSQWDFTKMFDHAQSSQI